MARSKEPARGEDAAVRGVLAMYREGWFPMHDDESGRTHWVQPHGRAVVPIEPGAFRVSRSLRSRVKSGRFEVTSDRAFERVIRACAEPGPGREGTWLSDEIIETYQVLHERGLAHSVEAWTPGPGRRLVGGLYGLAVGGVFCGESMFSRPDEGGTDASKVCLVHLVHHLRRRGFVLLDAQLSNHHLEQFGTYLMPRAEYLAILERHGEGDVPWPPWEPAATAAEVGGKQG
jgi:leucyl/phenylalanyl-tRNA---protein transferase